MIKETLSGLTYEVKIVFKNLSWTLTILIINFNNLWTFPGYIFVHILYDELRSVISLKNQF